MGQSAEIISHWHHSVEGLSTSTLEFYGAVERTLNSKEVPALHIGRTVVNERGVLSAKREYLSVRYDRLTFEVCAAPFGKDFFFSWWLTRRVPGFGTLWGILALVGATLLAAALITNTGFIRGTLLSLGVFAAALGVVRYNATEGDRGVEDALLATPLLGRIYRHLLSPLTYYSEDTRLMFEDAVHRVVVEVVEGILTINKMPPIPAERVKPRVHVASA